MDTMTWNVELVKGLRMLAPMCTAKDANFWLMEELRKERSYIDADRDCMTKHTVHAVFTAFVAKGYKAKTLTQAQRENKEKAALIARNGPAANAAYKAPVGWTPYVPRKPWIPPTPYGTRHSYQSSRPAVPPDQAAAYEKLTRDFKFPWEMDASPGASNES